MIFTSVEQFWKDVKGLIATDPKTKLPSSTLTSLLIQTVSQETKEMFSCRRAVMGYEAGCCGRVVLHVVSEACKK